jgi:hypothetical protein
MVLIRLARPHPVGHFLGMMIKPWLGLFKSSTHGPIALCLLSGLVACSSGGGQEARDATVDTAITKSDTAVSPPDVASVPDAILPGTDGSIDLGIDRATDDVAVAADAAGADRPVVDVGAGETYPFDGVDLGSDAGSADLSNPDLALAAKDGASLEAPLAGTCIVSFANSTANVVSSAPITSNCIVAQFGDASGNPVQWNFGADDTVATIMRSFNVDWFDVSTPVGTTLKVEDGYALGSPSSKGTNVSYMEMTSTGDSSVWTGDSGLVTLTSIADGTYTFSLRSVHLSPMVDAFGLNKATGAFELNGTVTAILKVVK